MSDFARIEAMTGDVTAWRQEIHRHPGTAFDVGATAAFVAEKLRGFGLDEVVEGVGHTGVVGVLKGRHAGSRAIGLRADMDALPISEQTNRAYASREPGKMHACGHDGHTAMLLGAARYLSADRDFPGTVVFVFQPAEEISQGAEAMIADGLFERFPVDAIYGLHSLPGLPVGQFATRPGAIMASVDRFDIVVEARGAHAAMPHQGIDAVYVASQIVVALQAIVARNIDPLEPAVVSVAAIRAGEAFNVLPDTATLRGTARALTPTTRDTIERRLRETAEGVARLNGAVALVTYDRISSPTVNHSAEAGIAARIAGEGRWPGPQRGRHAAPDDRRGLRALPRTAPRRLQLHRQRRHARIASSGLRLRRPGDPSRIAYWVGLVEAE